MTTAKTEDEILEVAERAARAGGNTALRMFRSDDMDVETKDGKTDYVTRADIDAQQRVTEVIEREFPEHEIVGEENDALKSMPDGPVWVVDPIDGTNNYVRGMRNWTTSVAFVRSSETQVAVNYLPALDDIYVADSSGMEMNGKAVQVSERTDPETFKVAPTVWWDLDRRDEYASIVREIVERFGDMLRLGSAQFVLSLVAAGSLEGVVTNVEVNPWDSIAGVYMVRQAGGVVTDVHGDEWEPGCEGLVASNGTAHEELLGTVQQV